MNLLITPGRLANAVAAICPEIEERVEANRPELDERGLWWELSCCVLSSQVSYALAAEAANTIDRSGLLLDGNIDKEELSLELSKILSEKLRVGDRMQKYRFPSVKASQLASTRLVITRKAGSLSGLITSFEDATEARAWFVTNAPGLGPKQASMLLRNAGVSYELAILDRHVLSYMAALGLYQDGKQLISGLVKYLYCEIELKAHAKRMGISVGVLDWAIWIVMRVANDSNRGAAAV